MRHALKVLLAVALVFSFIGFANAAGIPIVVDPKNAPEVWTMEVYNGSSSSLTSGMTVLWNIDGDTTHVDNAYRTMWIETSATADSIWTAGVVVSDTIAATSQGTIAIWGPVYALVQDAHNAVGANTLVGSSDNLAGTAEDFTGGADAKGSLGVCIYAAPVSSAYGGYDHVDGYDYIMLPIFVNPTQFEP